MPEYIECMAEPNRSTAESAWRDYGEVVVVDTREEAVEISDRYAPEHLEVQCDDRLHKYFPDEKFDLGIE
ncbi:MAG: hypothetical protein GY806_00750 [Gammaproteobacteria bacterium]|nr:hypothetical protein [Gammaproteobacteria bacterium]